MTNRFVNLFMTGIVIGLVVAGAFSCSGDEPDYGVYELPPVHTDLTYFKDDAGRFVYFNGINASGSTKLPWGVPLTRYAELGRDCRSPQVIAAEAGRTANADDFQRFWSECRAQDIPFEEPNDSGVIERVWIDYKIQPVEFIGEPYSSDARYRITYVNKPFPMNDADKHYKQLRDLGFNSIRLLINWEGLMPFAPPVNETGDGFDYAAAVDPEYVEYIHDVVVKAAEYGIYVLVDMHQDAWSRHLAAQYNDTFDDVIFGDSRRGEDGLLGANVAPYWDTDEDRLEPGCPVNIDLMSGLEDPSALITGLITPEFLSSLSKDLAYPYYYLLGCPERGSIGAMVLSLLLNPEGQYDNVVSGEGAPWWAVQAALPEKDMNHENWGYPRFFAQESVTSAVDQALGSVREILRITSGNDPGDLSGVVNSLPDQFKIDKFVPKDYRHDQTTDMLPVTTWGLNMISVDMERCWASFFAGRDAFPKNFVRRSEISADINIQDYLQDAYESAWVTVAGRVGDLDNVIGYDIINEPMSLFLTLTALAAYFDLGLEGAVFNILSTVLDERGADPTEADSMAAQFLDLLQAVNLLPDDTTAETRKLWGLEHANLGGIVGLNIGFDANYAQAYYEKIGGAIEEVDEDAIIWFESTMGLDAAAGFLGGGASGDGGVMQVKPSRPKLNQVVYAPHWYPDIYPFPGFAMPPREFVPSQIAFRDYVPNYQTMTSASHHHYGNIPMVVGEFGTWFNFNQPRQQNTPWEIRDEWGELLDWSGVGYDDRQPNGYEVAAEVLDNHYEAHEQLFQHRMLWCWSAENDWRNGEGWNHEDFSVVDPDLKPRAEEAFNRPYPRALSGKPHEISFKSKYHYFDPDKGEVDQLGEFILRFGSKQTEAPTEIFVPEVQYPEGFYVYLSDGRGYYDHIARVLYYYPTADAPGAEHVVVLRRPLEGDEAEGWNYFIKDDMVLAGPGGGLADKEVR